MWNVCTFPISMNNTNENVHIWIRDSLEKLGHRADKGTEERCVRVDVTGDTYG